MSRFLTQLATENINSDYAGGRGMWEVIKPLVYESDCAGETFTVPVGFRTDFASVLRLPVIYLLFGDKAHAPATLHDFLYTSKIVSRKVADEVFYEAMKAGTRLSLLERSMMWAAVRVFGGTHYGNNEKQGAEAPEKGTSFDSMSDMSGRG